MAYRIVSKRMGEWVRYGNSNMIGVRKSRKQRKDLKYRVREYIIDSTDPENLLPIIP